MASATSYMDLKRDTCCSLYIADPKWRLIPAAFEESPVAPRRNAWTVSKALGRCWTVWRREGSKALCFKILGETVYRRLRLLVMDLNGPTLRITPSIDSAVRVLDGTDRDASLYTAFRVDTSAREFCRRISDGGECFAAIHGEDIVSATWAYAGRGPFPYLSAFLEAGSAEIVLSDSYTLPDFRGHNLSPVVIAEIARHYRDRGFQFILTGVLPENDASFRSRRKTQFRVGGTVGFVGPHLWRRHFCRIYPEFLRRSNP